MALFLDQKFKIYMGGEIPKGGGGGIFIGVSPGGGASILGISPPFWEGERIFWGGGAISCDTGRNTHQILILSIYLQFKMSSVTMRY